MQIQTKPNLPNQTYQTKNIKPNLPNQTYAASLPARKPLDYSSHFTPSHLDEEDEDDDIYIMMKRLSVCNKK